MSLVRELHRSSETWGSRPAPASGKSAVIAARGCAFDRRHASKQSVWSTEFKIGPAAGATGRIQATRRFSGIASLVSEEVGIFDLQTRLPVSVDTNQPHLNERCAARFTAQEGRHEASYRIERGSKVVEREELSRGPFVPVSPMPLVMAWRRDEQAIGERIHLRYPVLKVARSTTVEMSCEMGQSDQDEVAVSVTPTSPLLKLLFGSTRFGLSNNLTALASYDGLLEPRDAKKRGGRWFEYSGQIRFEQPLPLPTHASVHRTRAYAPDRS